MARPGRFAARRRRPADGAASRRHPPSAPPPTCRVRYGSPLPSASRSRREASRARNGLHPPSAVRASALRGRSPQGPAWSHGVGRRGDPIRRAGHSAASGCRTDGARTRCGSGPANSAPNRARPRETTPLRTARSPPLRPLADHHRRDPVPANDLQPVGPFRPERNTVPVNGSVPARYETAAGSAFSSPSREPAPRKTSQRHNMRVRCLKQGFPCDSPLQGPLACEGRLETGCPLRRVFRGAGSRAPRPRIPPALPGAAGAGKSGINPKALEITSVHPEGERFVLTHRGKRLRRPAERAIGASNAGPSVGPTKAGTGCGSRTPPLARIVIRHPSPHPRPRRVPERHSQEQRI